MKKADQEKLEELQSMISDFCCDTKSSLKECLERSEEVLDYVEGIVEGLKSDIQNEGE